MELNSFSPPPFIPLLLEFLEGLQLTMPASTTSNQNPPDACAFLPTPAPPGGRARKGGAGGWQRGPQGCAGSSATAVLFSCAERVRCPSRLRVRAWHVV